jgi:hypothetical protein
MNTQRLIGCAAVVISMAGCVQKKSLVTLGQEAIESPPVTVGLRSVYQIVPSMSAAIGMPITTQIRQQGVTITPWFSGSGNASEYNSSAHLALVGLAGLFCRDLVNADSAISDANASQRKVFKNMLFSTAPATAFTPTRRQQTINDIHARVLRREPSEDEAAVLNTLITETIASGNESPALGSLASNQEIAKVLCTAVLGSTEFITQ